MQKDVIPLFGPGKGITGNGFLSPSSGMAQISTPLGAMRPNKRKRPSGDHSGLEKVIAGSADSTSTCSAPAPLAAFAAILRLPEEVSPVSSYATIFPSGDHDGLMA